MKQSKYRVAIWMSYLHHTVQSVAVALIVTAGGATDAKAVDPASSRVMIGLIRWDAWFSGSPFARELVSGIWPDRLPFYAKRDASGHVLIDGTSERTTQIESAYAKASGADYFIFGMYSKVNKNGSSNEIMANFSIPLENFINHGASYGMNFSVYIGPNQYSKDISLQEALLQYVKSPVFQTIDGKPLLFILLGGAKEWIDQQNNIDDLKETLNLTRKLRGASGLPPYIVVLDFYPERAAFLKQNFGFDAVSSYGNPLGSRPSGQKSGEANFERCIRSSMYYWSRMSTSDGFFWPPISLGWDYRPVMNDPGRGKDPEWCDQPQRAGVEEAIRSGLKVAAKTRARSIVVYAWNEFTEGGFLVPSACQGADKLRGFAAATGSIASLDAVLRKYPLSEPNFSCVSSQNARNLPKP